MPNKSQKKHVTIDGFLADTNQTVMSLIEVSSNNKWQTWSSYISSS